ncbi:MAG TPA: Ig-like domain-containing protein [Pyrinomonadaceae bacterium]|nr:Ig-like domain-containing protein [Pyrinomonadaceae bacterium]
MSRTDGKLGSDARKGQKTGKDATDPAALMAANNFRMLQAGEFAVVSSASGGDAASPAQTVVQLSDGQQYSFPQTSGDATTILETKPGVATYVREGAGLTVRGSSVGNPNEKIDSRLRKAGGDADIPVIIRFKLSYKNFYDGMRGNAAMRFQKRQEFKSVRNRVAAMLAEKGRIKHDLLIINGVSANIDAAALDQLAQDDSVARVEPDVTAHITLDTSVDEIFARETWQLSDGNNNPLTGVGQRIAIIDTGVDYTHPDLGACLGANCKVAGGWNFLANNSNPLDDNGHGTHVAATAAGNGLLKGVAPDAKILAYKVCDAGGSCAGSHIIAAIDYATDPNRDGDVSDHVDVASMSIGGGGNPDDSMSLAVDNATAAGVVLTIAAGNTGPGAGTIESPGTARTAITVAAACKQSQVGVDSRCATPIASFSSRGPLVWNDVDLQKPDVSAPGVNICAARWGNAFAGSPTCFDSQHIRISGTSMATPHVAGAAALVRQAFPGYTPEQVKQLLKNTARGLGVPYDAQGAGEINLRAAIPGSNKVNAQPGIWEAYSDPSVKTTHFDTFFDITPTDATISTLTLSANLPVPGVAVSFDKTTLNVAGQTGDFFFATMTVDNDVARTGNYSGSIVLSEGGQTKGIIPIFLHIAATVSIAPSPIVDYGVDNPSLPTWTSDARTLTVTNLRSDISQTLNITPSTYPAGINFQSPAAITVPPEGAVNINTNFFVDNAAAPNGSYSGSLRFSNSTIDTSVTTKFVKFYALTISDGNASGLQGATAYLHNRGNMQLLFNVSANPTTLYLDAVGPYDLLLYYRPVTDAAGTHEYNVFKESISLTGGAATVAVSRSDAVYQTKMVGTDPGGASVGALGIRDTFDQHLASGLGVIRLTGATDYTTNYYSAVSAAYRHSEFYEANRQAAPVLNFYYGGFTGLSANTTYTNTPADFKTVQVKVDLNRDSGTAQPLVFTCPPGSIQTCIANSNVNFTLPVPITQTINSLLPANAYQYQISDNFRTGCPPGGACPSAYRSLYLDLATHTRKGYPSDPGFYPSWDSGTTYNGLGPSLWVARFANTNGSVRLLPTFGTFHTAFMRQDYVYQEYDPVPYVLTSNGATVASGSLPTGSISSWPFLPFIGVAAGKYQFKINSFPYFNRGVSLSARVVADFDTALADANPPSLTQLKYTTGGQRSDQHDSNATNQLYFEMDANGGSLSQVTAGFSNDVNGTFIPLTLSPSGGGYAATVPAVPYTKLALRLTGVDNSNNRLEYTFELPAINPVADTTAPTASITAPSNGQTVTGLTTVQVSAQDNFGVARVELYQDGALIGTKTAAPYDFSWNTDATTDGGHALLAKAYDDAGNVGNSNTVNVTVSHDLTPPTVSLTAPAAGAILTGTVTVSANATDNKTVARVEFYKGGTLLGTDTTAPYSVQWNTAAETPGSYTLTAKAFDTAGNNATSAPRSVTVKDGIAPTASITSPANNATVTRKTTVNISATATDNIGVSRVEFYVNNSLTCTDTAAPYACAWQVPNNKGTFSLQAKSFDAAGNVGTSTVVSVTSK